MQSATAQTPLRAITQEIGTVSMPKEVVGIVAQYAINVAYRLVRDDISSINCLQIVDGQTEQQWAEQKVDVELPLYGSSHYVIVDGIFHLLNLEYLGNRMRYHRLNGMNQQISSLTKLPVPSSVDFERDRRLGKIEVVMVKFGFLDTNKSQLGFHDGIIYLPPYTDFSGVCIVILSSPNASGEVKLTTKHLPTLPPPQLGKLDPTSIVRDWKFFRGKQSQPSEKIGTSKTSDNQSSLFLWTKGGVILTLDNAPASSNYLNYLNSPSSPAEPFADHSVLKTDALPQWRVWWNASAKNYRYCTDWEQDSLTGLVYFVRRDRASVRLFDTLKRYDAFGREIVCTLRNSNPCSDECQHEDKQTTCRIYRVDIERKQVQELHHFIVDARGPLTMQLNPHLLTISIFTSKRGYNYHIDSNTFDPALGVAIVEGKDYRGCPLLF